MDCLMSAPPLDVTRKDEDAAPMLNVAIRSSKSHTIFEDDWPSRMGRSGKEFFPFQHPFNAVEQRALCPGSFLPLPRVITSEHAQVMLTALIFFAFWT